MGLLNRMGGLIGQLIGPSENPLNSMPDFSSMTYQYSQAPPNSTIPAWEKIKECERRWVFFTWAESLNNPRKAQHRIVLDDALAAFLLSYEATLQYVKDAFLHAQNAPAFDQWVAGQQANDILVKGLRTLRLLEAHIIDVPIQSLVKLKIGESLPDGTSETHAERIWRLPTLNLPDLANLRSSKLTADDLQDWNNLVEQVSAADLLETSLARLNSILSSAEAHV